MACGIESCVLARPKRVERASRVVLRMRSEERGLGRLKILHRYTVHETWYHVPVPVQVPVRNTRFRLLSEWIRAHLEFHHLACRSASGFHVKRRARADGRPDCLALPPGIRIVDAP